MLGIMHGSRKVTERSILGAKAQSPTFRPEVCGPDAIGVDSLYQNDGCIGMQNFGDVSCKELRGGKEIVPTQHAIFI